MADEVEPTGYLVDMICKNRPVPRNFKLPAQKATEAATTASFIRQGEVTRDYIAASSEAFAAFLETLLAKERVWLESDAEATLLGHIHGARRSGELMQPAVRGAVRERLEKAGRFSFPSFEAWQARG
jgi:hypothetical protein